MLRPEKSVPLEKKVPDKAEHEAEDEHYYMLSQWQLMWRKFTKHKIALFSVFLLVFMYLVATTFEFWAPYNPLTQFDQLNVPPMRTRIIDEEGRVRRPFVYGLTTELDMHAFVWVYTEDTSDIRPIRFFVRGEPYRLLGFFQTDVHLFGVDEGQIFILGSDRLGRDLFSRILAGSRVSLFIGLLGVIISFIFGSILGGISGYFGGTVDMVIQRTVECLLVVPQIPLWMALSAAVPADWSSIQVFFAMTIILSVLGWAGLARVIRGKILELREQEFMIASKVAGASDMRLIFDHLLPGCMSYLIVHLTLAIPTMIIVETSLSFLRLGIRPPAVSWGTLLQAAQNVRSLSAHPWYFIPAVFVIVTVLLFNFVGDGLRDAADPYK